MSVNPSDRRTNPSLSSKINDHETRITTNESSIVSLGSRATVLEGQNTYGWSSVSDTFTYASDDDPTFTITVPSDATIKYSPGMRLKLTQTTVKYFIITAVAATTLTVYGGTDYNLTSAAISNVYISYVKAPLGFPLDPTKWTQEFTSTATGSQSSTGSGTWYNLGGSLVIPIGAWKVEYSCYLSAGVPSTTGNIGYSYGCTLSTANNSESDKQWTDWRSNVWYISGAAAGFGHQSTMRNLVTLSTKSTRYLNAMMQAVANIAIDGSYSTTTIRAISAYL